MVKVYVKADVLKSLKERQEKNKLEYFKRELLKVLEQAEIVKEFNDYMNQDSLEEKPVKKSMTEQINEMLNKS